MSEHTQKQPHEMPDEELNIAVAKAAGYWVYHYDKDYEANCYYMLCLPNTVDSAVIDDFRRFRESGWHAGERKTEELAWKDAPYFASDLNKIWLLFKEHGLLHKRNYFPKGLTSVQHWLDFAPERAARLMCELFLVQMGIKANMGKKVEP